MTNPGHNSGGDRLRSFFERWTRLEADKQAIAEDLKELFSEAKGDGWNTKAMRAVFRDKAKIEAEDGADRADRQEFEALCEMYRDALDKPRAQPAPAREENIEEIPPHDEVTGEITDDVGSSNGRTPAFEAENEGSIPSPATTEQESQAVEPSSGTASTLAGQRGDESPAPIEPPAHPPAQAEAGEGASSSPSPATDDDGLGIPDFLKRSDGYAKREAEDA